MGGGADRDALRPERRGHVGERGTTTGNLSSMGEGYQERDHEVVDYELYETPGLKGPVRGPDPGELKPGAHIVFVGAAQTFGCYAARPFPALIGEALDAPVLNLGIAGAGPSLFARPHIIHRVNQSALAVVQVMSGRSESNSVFEYIRSDMLRVRADGRRVAAATAWGEYLAAHDRAAVDELIEETRRNWVAEYVALLDAIRVPTVLLWISKREPAYERTYDSAAGLYGPFPQLVDDRWMAEIAPHADRLVTAVSDRGMPQRLISRFTGEPVATTRRTDFGGGQKEWNNYYPSPEMHEDAAAALLPVCRELWEGRPGGAAGRTYTRHTDPAGGSRMIISVHVPKTAGISLIRAWDEAFPDRVLRDYPNEFGATEHRYADATEVAANAEVLREHYDVIHGHFHADKYLVFADQLWVIFLREPVDRVVSLHEQFRRRLERGRTLASADHADAVRAVERDPATVTEFARMVTGPQGAYRRYVGRDGLDRFSVVGLTERYGESLELLGAATGITLPQHQANTSEPTALKQYVADYPAVAAELRDIVAADVEIYERGVARFEELRRSARAEV